MPRPLIVALFASCATLLAHAQQPAVPQPAAAAPAAQQPAPNPSNLGSDANGNPLRKALKTGHI